MEDGMRILYVDDEPALLNITQIYLEKLGDFKVSVSESAREALDLLSHESYDAIISDYQMPDINGIEFLKTVRERFGDIPFVLFTGRGREEVVIAAINNGADFYIQKGGDPKAQFSELVHKVQHAIRRKQAETSLKESEEKYRMLVEHNRDGVFIIQDGRLVFYNMGLVGLSSYTPEELDGKLLAELIAPEDRDMVISRARERVKGMQVPERYEFSLIHKDGINRTRLRVSTFLGSYRGRPASFGTFYDVTEDRKREEALQESEEKFRTILENIQDVYYRTDKDGNILMISPSGANLLGYTSVDELLGCPIAQKIYANPDARAEFLAAINEKGSVRDFEVNLRHTNGSIVTISSNSHYYYNPDGSIAGIEGVFRDITERKKIEEALKRSENLYRTVFENTGTASILIGPDTTILRANAGFERLTGVPRQEQENKLSWTTFIHRDDVERMKEFHYTRRRDRAGVPTVYECRLIDAKKDIHFCYVHVDVIPGTENSIASLVDVTPLKHAEEALKESEGKIRTILDNLPDLIVVHREGTILYANPAMTGTMGWRPEEVVGQPIMGYIAPEYHAKVAAAISERMGNGQNVVYDIELFTREGKRRIVSVRGTVITFEGSPAIMSVLTDITAAKNTERALLESEEKYRSLVENTNDILYSTDITGRITNISPQISRYGYTSEDIVSNNLASFILAEDLPVVLADVEKTVSTGNSTITVFRVKDKSGMIHWMEDNGSAIFDESGSVIGLSGILRDITDRRRAEDALHESEERFRSLVETSPDMIWEIDSKGTFLYVSPMVTRIMGYTQDEVIGKSIADLVPERERPFVIRELIKDVSSDGPLSPIEVTARHRNGHDMTLEIRPSKLIDANGRLNRLRGVAVDITERKKAENALRLANHQLNLITSITCHDINNKISIILGYLGITKGAISDPLVAEYIGKIESATNAIQSLIGEARVYQELGSKKPQWQDLESTLPWSHVPATITLNADVQGIDVYADMMLRKVFFNLLDNSIQHGQHVTEITVSSGQSREGLTIMWEDNGIGIAVDEKERIFEREIGKNTGLGLFLVREILSLTGITIREIGEPGRGVRFEITVPVGQYRISPH